MTTRQAEILKKAKTGTVLEIDELRDVVEQYIYDTKNKVVNIELNQNFGVRRLVQEQRLLLAAFMDAEVYYDKQGENRA